MDHRIKSGQRRVRNGSRQNCRSGHIQTKTSKARARTGSPVRTTDPLLHIWILASASILIVLTILMMFNYSFRHWQFLTTPEIPDFSEIIYEIPDIKTPLASGVITKANEQIAFDFSHKHNGYIMAERIEKTGMRMRLIIETPNKVEYIYDLHENRGYDVFPLQDGNGKYIIKVFRQHECGLYSKILSTSVDVILADEFSPFIYPNQLANFTEDSTVVHKAAVLTVDLDDHTDKIAAISDFIATTIIYEELPESLNTGYVPDPNEVLQKGRGTCFDISVLTVSMLRSQGIPAKLVFGYVDIGDRESFYHAWVEVYNGETWQLLDPTFSIYSPQAILIHQPNYSEEFIF